MSLKKTLVVLAVAVLPLAGLNAAEKAKATKAPSAPVAAKADVYTVDAAQSQVKWLAKKVTGQHNGSITLKSGSLTVSNGNVTAGQFVIDMASLTNDDLTGESKEKLTGHLKSDDFFGVATNPTSTFDITSVEKAPTEIADATHIVKGNLTIKGKTNPLSFPAKIEITPAGVTASAKGIMVDRTLYNIKYGSGKFFKGLGDKVIYDQFWLDASVVAKK